MKQNIIREITRVTNSNIRYRAPLKNLKMQIKLANNIIEDFTQNLTLLNEMIFATAAVINSLTIT